jgi:hypothetical protein
MKPLSFFLVVMLFTGCASATPAPTSTLTPTSVPTPTPTPIPLSEIDLETVLLQSGDLPPSFEAGQIKTTLPRPFSKLPTPDNVITQDMYEGGFKAEPGIMILLYGSTSDRDEAYESLVSSENLVPCPC